ncbi:TrgA family protein [Roseivivax sp.]
MPTAPKLVAGLLLALLAYAVTKLVVADLPDSVVVGLVAEVNAVLAFIVGWRVIGRGIGRGSAAAITNGITGTAVATILCLGVQATDAMVEESLKKKYSSVFEAVDGGIAFFLEYGSYLLVPQTLGLMALGAVIAGVAAEVASHYWR